MKRLHYFNFLFVIITLLLVNCTRSKINVGTDLKQLYAVWNSDDYKDSLAQTLKPAVLRALSLNNTVSNRASIDSVLSELRWTRDSTSFHNLSAKALNFATSSSDKYMLANIYNDFGMYYHDLNQLDSTFYYYLKSENVYKQLADSIMIGEMEFYQARLLFEKGLHMESEVKTTRALHLLRNAPKNPVPYEANQLMGLCMMERKDYTLAKVYLLRALELMQQDIDKNEILDKKTMYMALGMLYGNLSDASFRLKDYRDASEYAAQSVKYSKESTLHLLVVAYGEVSKARADFMMMRTLDMQVDVEDYLVVIRDGIKLSEEVKNYFMLIQFYMVGANMYFEAGQFDKSFEWAEKSYQIALMRDMKPFQRDALEFIVTHKKYENNIVVKNLIALSKDLEKQDYITRNRFARIAYETEKIEIENVTLRNLIYTVLIASMFVIITLLIGVYITRLRSKNREILLIKEQQKANDSIYQLILEKSEIATDAKNSVRNKIARDIHDGVVNGIFTIRFSLQQLYTDNEELKQALIKELQTLEKSTRDISHSLIDNELFYEKKFISLIEELLSLQKNEWNTEFLLKCDYDIDIDKLSAIDKVNTYFIIREAIQNINKYSEASTCIVSFTKEEDYITVMIKDNGVGFDELSGKGGIGMQNMRERALALHSDLRVYSQKKSGTVLTFKIHSHIRQ